jgi:hypothetical protein
LSAESIADHRLAYLDYEGPVSRERGSVQRWDTGSVDWLEQSAELIRLKVAGTRLHGELSLRRPNTAPLWGVEFVRLPNE